MKLFYKNDGSKLYCLEGLKGVGACVVAFVWHYQHFSPQEGYPLYNLIPSFYTYGWLMVELFFMLSGFGMLLGYENKIAEGKITFKAYIVKRIEKLYPLMTVTLLFITILQYIYKIKVGNTFIYSSYDIYHFLLNLSGLQNVVLGTEWSFNAPSWCIGITICCYIIFYFIVYRNGEKKKEWQLVLMYILLSLLGIAIILININLTIINTLMGRGLSCFFIGALLGKIYKNKEKINTRIIGYMCFVIVLLLYLLARVKGYETWGNVQLTVILGIAPMLIIGVLFVPWLKKIFEFRPFVWLGGLSLSIYLWHFPVQCLMEIINIYGNLNINFSSKKIWCLYIIIVILVSSVFQQFMLNKLAKGIKKIFIIKV